jgi:hypothetical protein
MIVRIHFFVRPQAVDELEKTCGDAIRAGRPKVFFRTTPGCTL